MAVKPRQTGARPRSTHIFCATWLVALALLATTADSALANTTVAGQASVIDGDTIEVRGTRLRLHGIDAPESDQTCTAASGSPWRCGQRAALALDEKISGRPVRCERRDVDRYGRVVAECFQGELSLNRWMVRQGWAIAYRQYSTAYVGDEERARKSRLNIWSGHFDAPADHRRADRTAPRPQVVTAAPDPACPLKGNINRRGDRIYHEPGQADYDRTVINTADGERWFCSPEEARAAGWRPARR